jgi:hypothetical protein
MVRILVALAENPFEGDALLFDKDLTIVIDRLSQPELPFPSRTSTRQQFSLLGVILVTSGWQRFSTCCRDE